MPHPREWLRNDMEHAHPLVQKRHMIIPHIPYTDLFPLPWREEAAEIILLIRIHERPALSQSVLSGDKLVEEPCCVREVGPNFRPGSTEEIEED